MYMFVQDQKHTLLRNERTGACRAVVVKDDLPSFVLTLPVESAIIISYRAPVSFPFCILSLSGRVNS